MKLIDSSYDNLIIQEVVASGEMYKPTSHQATI